MYVPFTWSFSVLQGSQLQQSLVEGRVHLGELTTETQNTLEKHEQIYVHDVNLECPIDINPNLLVND